MSSAANLLLEAARINYRLRSTFFLRRLEEYSTLTFSGQIAGLIPFANEYDWTKRAEWGIGDDAFDFISGSEMLVLQVFAHPKVLREHPNLIAYYRNLAVLSQKAVSQLARINVKPYEAPRETGRQLVEANAMTLARLFNEHITLIINSSVHTFSSSEVSGLILASTGAQIDGSWRNSVGDEAEKVVQRLLVKEALERDILRALLPRSIGAAPIRFDPSMIEEQLTNIRRYKGFMLINGTSFLFSSDPDVSLINQTGNTVAVVEVKGGVDPAGALERYGAAKKSFAETPNATTILVASCITPEVEQRIKQDPAISIYYNLMQILGDDAIYQNFADRVFGLLGL